MSRQTERRTEAAGNVVMTDIDRKFMHVLAKAKRTGRTEEAKKKLLKDVLMPVMAGTRRAVMAYIEEAYLAAYYQEAKELAVLLGADDMTHPPAPPEWKDRPLNGMTARARVNRALVWYRMRISHELTAKDLTGAARAEMLTYLTGEHGDSGVTARISRIVRTEGSRAQAIGSIEAMRAAGVEWYRYRALLDDRTCTPCHELDGHMFRVDDAEEGMNIPPLHPNCRCWIEPVID